MATTNILDLNNRVTELEKNKGSGGGGTAEDVTYDPTASHLEATNVQDAIDELSGEIAGLSADDVSYDGTDSGLSAVTVQSAIDETVNKIETIEAADVSYDNTSSGLASTDVQGAVNELDAILDSMRFYTIDVPATKINTQWAGTTYYTTITLAAPENLTDKKLFMSFERTTIHDILGWSARVISNGTQISFSMSRPDNTGEVSGKLHLMVKD